MINLLKVKFSLTEISLKIINHALILVELSLVLTLTLGPELAHFGQYVVNLLQPD